jgi:hypothetical protein
MANPMHRTVIWRKLDGPGIEHCSLAPCPGGWQLQGTAIRAGDGPLLVRYTVTCDALWHTRAVEIDLEAGTNTRALRLTVGDKQRWWSAGAELAAFRGCDDIDLGITPATNTLPIRRLNLAVGEARAVTAAWVQFPTLAMEPLPQLYTRLDTLRYRYESGNGAYETEIAVDELGLVTRYDKGWERIATAD